MTADDLTKLATGLGVIVSALLGVLTWRANQRTAAQKATQETTQQRTDRESTDREGDLKRYDEGLWRIVGELRGDLVTVKQELSAMRQEVTGVQRENGEMRSDMVLANMTTRTLTAENERLKAEMAMMRADMEREQRTTAELRADLGVANGTIRDLKTQNQRQGEELSRLRAQITALQGQDYRGPVNDDDKDKGGTR